LPRSYGALFRGDPAQRLLTAAVTVKALDGSLELVGGVLLFLVPAQDIAEVVRTLTQHELTEDPRDPLATHLRAAARALAASGWPRQFTAAYLVGHGVIKLVLAAAVLRRQVWAYPPVVIVLAGFVAYQGYRYEKTHSMALLVLAGLDLLVAGLVVREYRRLHGRGNRSVFDDQTSGPVDPG
jgi:uncharacterized membrane protein